MNAPDLMRLLEGAGASPAGIDAVCREVERMQASAEQRLAIIVDVLPVVVSYIDAEQRYRFMSRTYELWFGRPRDEVLGKSVHEVLGDAIFERLREPLARALRGEGNRIEMTARLPALGERQLEVAFTPDVAPDGSVRGTVDLVTDVTDRRGMERAQDRMIDELTRTVKMNEWFIGILGHDLRNPLGAILMSATVLARKVTDDGIGRTVRRILSAGERMNRMIAQLVDFARVRASGGLTVEPKRSDAAAVFRLAVEQSAATQQDREVRFEHHGDTCGFWDGERLAQVAANLVGNAFRHGAPERAVEVQVVGTDPERVSIAVRNGGTIPGELLPRVFEPFQSAEVRSRRTALGLGLFITREIVASHRGNLMVDSTGDATTFTVTLPRGTPPARSERRGEPIGAGGARPEGTPPVPVAAADPEAGADPGPA